MTRRSSLACDICPVRDSAACAALAPGEREELSKIGHHLTIRRGDTMFSPGDGNENCATLISGALKISTYDEDGVERILSLIHPAGFVGELFTPSSHHHIIALTECRLCVFSRRQYEDAIERFPALALALLRRTSDDLFETRSLIDLVGHRSAIARLAGLLLAFSRAAGHSPCHNATEFDLPLTRGEIAGMLGMTIETVSRNLGKLEQDGLIMRSGARGIKLCDDAALMNFVA